MTGNNPERPEAETPATVGFRPVLPGQRAPQKRVVLGLITRRSWVQIPPPLLKENPGIAWVFCCFDSDHFVFLGLARWRADELSAHS